MQLIVASALITLIADRLAKLAVVEWMGLIDNPAGRVDVFPPYFNLVMAWNRGINFGFGSGDSDILRWVYIVIAFAVCIGLAVWGRNTTGKLVPLSIGLIIGGALGNVWDRIQYGAVADFLNMSCCGINNPYAFNPADVAIFIGAFGLIFFSDQQKKPDA